MSVQQTGSPEFQQFLQQCRRRYLLHTSLRGLAGVLLVGLLVVLCSMFADFIRPLSGLIRLVLLVLSATVAVVSCWRLVIRPLLIGITDDELGAAADLACPGFQEAVATVISVESPDAGDNEAGSQKMRARLRQQIGERLKTNASASIMDDRTTLTRCAAAATLLALAVIPLMIWRSGSFLLLQRFVTPLTSRATATNLYFTIQSPGSIVARGSDVVFEATPRWRDEQVHSPPQEASILLRADSGRTDSLLLKYNPDSHTFSGTLRSITDSVTWRIEAGRAASEDRRLTVVDSPRPIEALLTVTPPDYTGFPVVTWPGAAGDMEAFAGSHVDIRLDFNKPVTLAELVWQVDPNQPLNETQSDEPSEALAVDATIPMAIADDRMSAMLAMTAERGGRFQLRLQDDELPRTTDGTLRHLVVIHDQPPELAVRGLRSDDELRPDDVVALDCAAIDDVGVGALELHLTTPNGSTEIIAAPETERGRAEVLHEFRVDLANYSLTDGDQLLLKVRATDERPPEPHEVWWDPVQLTIDSNAAAPGTNALNEESRRLVQQLESARRQLREDTRAVRELRHQPAGEWDGRQQNDLTRLSERQQLLGRQLEDLAAQTEKHPLMKSTGQKLDQLGISLRSETGQQLQQASQQKDESAEESLRQAESQLIDARSELNSIIQQVEQAAAVEQDLAELNRLALKAEQLANDAGNLQQRKEMSAEEAAGETDSQALAAQLEAESQQIEDTRRQLSNELTDLLNRQRELQAAAQNVLMQRQSDVAAEAAELAERQQQLATLMEYENAADPATTAASQQQVAEEAEAQRQQLAEIAQQVRLPGIELEDQSSAVEAARQSAETAARMSASAGASAGDGQLAEAATAAGQAAAAMNRVAQLGQNSEQLQQNQDLMVPPEAGQNVTRALQHLSGSADADASPSSPPTGDQQTSPGAPDSDERSVSENTGDRNQTSADSGETQPADRDDAAADSGAQQGDGGPTELSEEELQNARPAQGRQKQLADAAAALSDAAAASLPGSILDQMEQLPLPGNMAGTASTAGGTRGESGSAGGPESMESQREWARLYDELGHDVLGGQQESSDTRYSFMIRAYFRELARLSTTSPNEEP